MPGMNRNTGRRMSRAAHIEQSIINLLGIRQGERVMMNDLGSEAVDLVDSPVNQFFLVEMAMGVLYPIRLWIPEVEPHDCRLLDTDDQGRAVVSIVVLDRLTGEQVRVEPIVLTAAGWEVAPYEVNKK